MLRGKLNRAALQSAMSTLSKSIESVRRLAALTPSSDRESEPTSRMSSLPSEPGFQLDISGAAGHALGLNDAFGSLLGVGVPVGSAWASVGWTLAPGPDVVAGREPIGKLVDGEGGCGASDWCPKLACGMTSFESPVKCEAKSK